MEFNLADLFECVADRVSSREALACAGRRESYAELDERATRLAHGLSELGARRGTHVGLYLRNCPEFVEAMLACFKLRAVPVNVNYRYVEEELAYLFEDADIELLVHHRAFSGRVGSVRRKLPDLRVAVVVEDGAARDPKLAPEEEPGAYTAKGAVSRAGGTVAYEAVLGAGSAERDLPERSGDDHYLLYTGGTTGLPKGVVWRQEDIFFATLGGGNPGGPPIGRPEQIADTVIKNRSLRLSPFLPEGDPGPEQFVSLALGPLMHASGQWPALTTLLGGAKLVIYGHARMDMQRVLQLVEAERVTMLTLVGDASARPLLDELERGSYDTSSVRLLGSGGSILSADLKERLLSAMPSVLAISEAVGSSEAPVQAVAIAQPVSSPPDSLAFSSRADTAVLDEQLRPVEPGSGAVGRLATRGRVPIGYHKDPERTARTFVEIDGERWSLPGDMATVDADGTIRLLGRGSLCINTGGEKVYPEEVEAVLKAHPDVEDALVVGVPDGRLGERVSAVVAPARQAAPTLEGLREHCRSRLAGYKAPRELKLVSAVRRSPAGKPDYRWARRVATGSP
jgi:acyl-CoA synthetase (AMP-forming)/AMP-acid ligase II